MHEVSSRTTLLRDFLLGEGEALTAIATAHWQKETSSGRVTRDWTNENRVIIKRSTCPMIVVAH